MKSSNPIYAKFLKRHKPKGRTLLVGSRVYPGTDDRRAMYEDCLGIDIQDGPGVDLVHDLEEPLKQRFKHVDCCSVLEHVRRPWLMADNIERCLEHKGTLMLSVPFVWRVHGYPSDYWRLSVDGVKSLFPRIKWTEIDYYSNGVRVDRAPWMNFDESPWFERTEVYGFGVKK